MTEDVYFKNVRTVTTADICIDKYWDMNGNGSWDKDEPPVVGAEFEIIDISSGSVAGGITTDADGKGCWKGTVGSKYQINELWPYLDGWGSGEFTLDPAGNNFTVSNDPPEYTIIICKDLPANGVAAANGGSPSFGFTSNMPKHESFTLGIGDCFDVSVKAGIEYWIAEDDPSGQNYKLVDIDASGLPSGGNEDIQNRKYTFTIPLPSMGAASVVPDKITFINEPVPQKVKVLICKKWGWPKDMDPVGDIEEEFGGPKFHFETNIEGAESFDLKYGQCKAVWVEIGQYYEVTEDPASCYQFNGADEDGCVDIVGGSGNTVTFEAGDTRGAGDLEADCGDCEPPCGSLTFYNTQKMMKIRVSKEIVKDTDLGGDVEGEIALPEFEFKTNLPGGDFTLKAGQHKDFWVPCGNEYWVEEAGGPECFEVDHIGLDGCIEKTGGHGDRIRFKAIDDDKAITEGDVGEECRPCGEITFYNARKMMKIKICKVLTLPEQEMVEEGGMWPSFTFKTNMPGVPGGTFTLGPGHWCQEFEIPCGIPFKVCEVDSAEGFQFADISVWGCVNELDRNGPCIKFKAGGWMPDEEADAGCIRTCGGITFENELIPGRINLHKTDAVSGEDLEGAVFALLSWPGEDPVNDIFGNPVENVTTDENGLASFENLWWGTYLVREVDPPTGYEPKEAVVTVGPGSLEVTLEGEIADPRKPGKIGILKLDEDGDPMTGAGFTLYNSAGTVVVRAEEMVDAAGKVAFENLDWGSYLIVETTVPDDYEKADDVAVTIDAENAGKTVNVTVTNDPEDTTTTVTVAGLTEGIQVLGITELPFTGMHPAIPISGISSILIGAGLFMASLKKRFRK